MVKKASNASDYIFAGRVRFRLTLSNDAIVSLRSIITLINKGILFALFIDVCSETNRIILIILVTVIISLIDETVMEMMDFSQDIFSQYHDREKEANGRRENGRGKARQTEKWKANILAMRT